MGTSLTRRRFVQRVAGWLAAVPFVWAVVAVLRRTRAAAVPASVTIPPDVPAGLSIVDSAIVYRSANGEIRAFSSQCTHMGCRIDRTSADEAICPCHGSRYRADGSVAAGPARRPLAPLRLVPDSATGGWTAHAS